MSFKLFGQSFLNLTVLVAGLGYLVDMFDFFLFNMLRVKSLTDLGLSGDALTQAGITIVNSQLIGLVLGAYIWGVFGDKFGRKNSLFGSIILYSTGVFLTAFVQTPEQYAIIRFITGLGLAGELGGGIALIAEKFQDQRRGYGVSAFIIMGFVGVVLAAIAANFLPWRVCYMIGGVAGVLVLIARSFIKESTLFLSMAETKQRRGGLMRILTDKTLAVRFIACVFLMLPTVFIPQILWTLSPEIAKNMGVSGRIEPQIVLGIGYTCVIFGDMAAALLAEKLRNRKTAIGVFVILGVLTFMGLFLLPITTVLQFYVLNALLGLTFGIWLISATVFAEQFGTNYRATVTTTIPNFARGLAIAMNLALVSLKPFGLIEAVILIGSVIFLLTITSWFILKDSYGRDLNYYD